MTEYRKENIALKTYRRIWEKFSLLHPVVKSSHQHKLLRHLGTCNRPGASRTRFSTHIGLKAQEQFKPSCFAPSPFLLFSLPVAHTEHSLCKKMHLKHFVALGHREGAHSGVASWALFPATLQILFFSRLTDTTARLQA